MYFNENNSKSAEIDQRSNLMQEVKAKCFLKIIAQEV